MKLKGIDGDPHKRWMMWINSMQREKPYPALTCQECLGDEAVPAREPEHRCCMAVVSSCREMLGQVLQRARPPPPVAIIELGTLAGPPATSRRKAGMTSSHHAPYALGHTRATMAGTVGSDAARRSGSQKPVPVRTGGCNPPPRSWNC